MFFTDVNKFTLTCDLNFQKKKKKKDRRKKGGKRGEWERKERRQADREEGSFKVIHTQVTSVKGLMRLPGKHFRKSSLPMCCRKMNFGSEQHLPFDAFSLFLLYLPSIFILRVDFKSMLNFINLFLWNTLGSCITKG